ncbi:MAG TPA: TIGR00282 family metallophosphoesterase [Clostridiales bacterium]|nr:TIGR00282 family metallophosphoesterase [Clostridiales bacterium]
MKILFVGDVVGNPGRKTVKMILPEMKRNLSIDYCIANCENAAGGSGITYAVAQELFNSGVDVITLGNHTWSKKEIVNFIDTETRVVRPANYPQELPGKGATVIGNDNKGSIGVLNLLGRVYLDSVDCPFRTAEKEIQYLKNFTKVIVVDMHAEATSEKTALAWYLDGKVSCVLGTHTHVQTADERILPCGTGYITDAGMTGPYEGILGVDREIIVNKFLTYMPAKFELAKGSTQFNAVLLDIDEKNGRTYRIKRVLQVMNV